MNLSPASRARAWIARWRPILPLLAAELILWLGFGALLPVLPLYFTEQGVDLATLGLVVAAWPAARLVGEPVFGWLADRSSRKLLMILGLVAAGMFTALPLVVTGPAAFIALRALTGVATSLYDPAARGYLTDATPPQRRGEAFGLYASSQMGGLLFGPLLGAVAAGVAGGIGAVFVLGAVSSFLGAGAIAVALVELPRRETGSRLAPSASTELSPDPPAVAGLGVGEAATAPSSETPRSLGNRLLVSAVILHFGLFFAVGTSEVVWSLYLSSIGAGLDLIGLTFAAFGLPVVSVSPWAGRLVDRRGSFGPVIAGSLTSAAAAFVYPAITVPVLTIPVIVLEGAGTSFCDPALYSIVARGSPPGRSSTAQGIFGAAGTVGFIVSSMLAGWLAGVNLRYPFIVCAAAILVTLAVSLAIAGPAIRRPVVREVSAEPSWGER